MKRAFSAEVPNWIDGRETPAASGRWFDKLSPDTGARLCRVARSEAPELPEDVAAYYKYKQETGRGLDDFMKVNRNLDEADGDGLLKEYLLITEDGLDSEDVDMMMEEYSFDEDLDDEAEIKKAKLAKKKAVAEEEAAAEEATEEARILITYLGGNRIKWRLA